MNRASHAALVVGDGATAWLAARSLARVLGPRQPVCVLSRPGEETTLHGAVALRPHTANWHPALQLEDAVGVNRAQGAFSFGAALSGWPNMSPAWFQPFSTFGAPIGPVGFYAIALRLREAGAPLRLADYSLAALAAQANRFQQPGREASSVLSTCGYGMHLSRQGLRAVLREDALALGVTEHFGEVVGLDRDDVGNIDALRLGDGERLGARLFIDASGPEARVAGLLDDWRWNDWRRWLANDGRMRVTARTLGVPPPYRHLERNDSGWTEHLPLHGAVQVSHFHRGEHGGSPNRLAREAGLEALDHVTNESHTPGRAATPWVANCVALGEASMWLEPLGGDAFHFARTALQRLLTLLPGDPDGAAVRAEFNRQVGLEQDHARDFAIAHHGLDGNDLPDSLVQRREVFRARATIALDDEEPYEPEAWLALFDAHGITPRDPGPLVRGLSTRQLVEHADKVRAFMLGALKTLPSHEDTLVSLHVAGGDLESTVESVSIAPPGVGPAHPGGH